MKDLKIETPDVWVLSGNGFYLSCQSDYQLYPLPRLNKMSGKQYYYNWISENL